MRAVGVLSMSWRMRSVANPRMNMTGPARHAARAAKGHSIEDLANS
jgi:hypothetical protein